MVTDIKLRSIRVVVKGSHWPRLSARRPRASMENGHMRDRLSGLHRELLFVAEMARVAASVVWNRWWRSHNLSAHVTRAHPRGLGVAADSVGSA